MEEKDYLFGTFSFKHLNKDLGAQGHLISESIFEVLNFPKNQRKDLLSENITLLFSRPNISDFISISMYRVSHSKP